MKWFHHECSARHDPKLQVLGDAFGMEGIGIYWSLLEEIGEHSDTFHLKVSGLSEQSDQLFMDLCQNPDGIQSSPFVGVKDMTKVPRVPLKILARGFYVSAKKLADVVCFAVQLGLFDSTKWLQFNVLHSSGFEHRADDYTRRQVRRTDIRRTSSEETPNNVRTLSEPSPDTLRTESEQSAEMLRTKSDKVLLEAEEEQKKNRRRKEKNICSAKRQLKISTNDPQKSPEDSMALIQLSKDDLLRYCKTCYLIIREWNETHAQRFDWQPAEVELKKLFYGGQRRHKMNLCYQAINVQDGEVKYAELVLRAVRLMLDASTRQRITNPFGWVWTCLHGNGDGTTPWVQLLTSDEETRASRAPP